MQGYQIAEKISQFGGSVYESLLGIFSIDQVPKSIPVDKFVICNLSLSNQSGSHWIVSLNKSNFVWESNVNITFHRLFLTKEWKTLKCLTVLVWEAIKKSLENTSNLMEYP